jgi:hypothetical protein
VLGAAFERAIAHLTNWKILDAGWRGCLGRVPELLRTVTRLEICRVWGRATFEWRYLRGIRLIAGGPRVGDRV